MILVDLNQVCISNLMQNIKHNEEIQPDLIKHMILNTLMNYRKKFKEEYGELVICCDSKKSWRRDIFPFYKMNRKQAREASNFDWNKIFECLNDIRDDLKQIFPYAVIEVATAEADDVIAVLVKHNYRKQKILILSSDKDFIQLQKYYNVYQYSPIQKKFVTNNNPHKYLIEHIIKGDRGDGIPNFLSDDDTYVTSKRSKKIMKSKLSAWVEMQPSQYCNEQMYRGYKRNEQLVSLDMIPTDITDKIVDQYDNYQYNQRDKLFNYFVDNKLKNLIEHIGEF